MVERVTITIKEETLKEIDSMIDGHDIRNRSHAIESLIMQSLGKLDTILLLGGGTKKNETPKPMIKIHGKTILEHQINMLKKYNINKIILSVGNKEIKDYFGNGSKFGVSIDYIIEAKPQGTVWPLHMVKSKNAFAVMNIDTLMNPNIPEISIFHRKNKALATMLLVTTEDTTKSGVVVMRGNNIVDFTEKPPSSESKLVNAGFYIFEPAVIPMLPKKGLIENTIFPKLAREGRLFGFVHDGMIFDVGKAEEYSKAIKKWKDA